MIETKKVFTLIPRDVHFSSQITHLASRMTAVAQRIALRSLLPASIYGTTNNASTPTKDTHAVS